MKIKDDWGTCDRLTDVEMGIDKQIEGIDQMLRRTDFTKKQEVMVRGLITRLMDINLIIEYLKEGYYDDYNEGLDNK